MRDDFADQLDASLTCHERGRSASASDDDECATTNEQPAAAERRTNDDDNAVSDPAQASSTDDDDERDDANSVASPESTNTQQNEETPKVAVVVAMPAVFDFAIATPEAAEDRIESPDEATEPSSTTEEVPADVAMTAWQPQTATKKADPNAAGRSAAPRAPSPVPQSVERVFTVPESTGSADGHEVTPKAETPVEAIEQASTESKSMTSVPPVEPDVRTTAAVTAATESAFDHLNGDRHDQSRNSEAARSEANHSTERSETRQESKAQAASPFDAHVTNHDTRPIVATAQGAMATQRIAEFEAAAEASETTPFTRTPAPDTPERIVQSLRLQFQRGGGDAVVHIKPEHLGPLTISLRVDNGTVSARVIADNPVVAEWLQANEQTLREGLKANGLQLDRLVINRDQDPSSRTPYRESPESRRGPQRRFDPRQSTFEISV